MALSRRRFLIGSGVAAGALAVGFAFVPEDDEAEAFAATVKKGEVALNAWLKIAPDGTVTVAIPRQEMGQGIYTSLAMLVAEELNADWDKVVVEQAPIDDVYFNATLLMGALPFKDGYHKGEKTAGSKVITMVSGLLGIQATGGSSSIRDAWEPMRYAGAAARDMLIEDAANKWNLPASQCKAENGRIVHGPSGRSFGYGELAVAAAELTPPADPKLKPSSEFKFIGKNVKRMDIKAKTNGEAVFGIDVKVPGMLYAAIKASPVFGGTLKSFDASKVSSMAGVKKVVPLADGVAVVADSWWRAQKALEELPATFDDGGNGQLSTDSIFARFAQEMESGDANIYTEEGEALENLKNGGEVLEAVYKAPYLAHACMEPINCTALVKKDSVEVWVSNQAPTLIRWMAAQAADIDSEKVTVHTPYLGGGFGRRAETDMVTQAVNIAKTMPGTPIKMVWTREEDTQHDMYRPAALSRFRANLDKKGEIVAWYNRIISQVPTQSVTGRYLPWAEMDMPDNTTSEGAANIPYAFPNNLVEHVPVRLPVPVGFWRSVGHSHNAFFSEGFLDEMAHQAGKDPYKFRRALLNEEHKDFRDVLDRVAKESGWDKPLGPGRGRGIALHESFGSIVAQVAEVTVTAEKELRVDRVVCVVDCGTVVNPDTVEAQMESGIIFGLTAAFYGEITLAEGRVQQGNFPDYQMIKLANSPKIETHLAPSGRHLGGVGEVSTPPIAPAVVNALFAATGVRIRELPLVKAGFVVD